MSGLFIQAHERLEEDSKRYFTDPTNEDKVNPADVWAEARGIDADEVDQLAETLIAKSLPMVPDTSLLWLEIYGTVCAAAQAGYEAAIAKTNEVRGLDL